MSSIRFFIYMKMSIVVVLLILIRLFSGYALYPSVIIVSTSRPHNDVFKNCLMYSALKYSRGIIASAIIILNFVSITVNLRYG